MNKIQMERMKNDKGFIAALDQSGGSTPKALANYGITKKAYRDDTEMFQLVHKMRTRIMESPYFTKEKILGAILFEKTMDLKVGDHYSGDYLWNVKGIIPILKVDKGLEDLENGVQLMRDIPNLEALLLRAKERNIFATKMRSVIKDANKKGIKEIVQQQFKIGKVIWEAGFLPILEPEVDIHAANKEEIEKILKKEILEALKTLSLNQKLMFKLTIPEKDNFYEEIANDKNVVRLVALSGGYSREEANAKLARNRNLIASFSRALTEGLNVAQSDEDFNNTMRDSIQSIYEATVSPK